MKIINHPDERDEKFERLKKMGIELSVPIPETHYRLLLENPGAEPVQINSRAHTWVRNYYNAIAAANFDINNVVVPDAGIAYGAGSLRMKNQYGQDGTTGNYTGLFHYNGSMAGYRGILLGTSDTAYSAEDYVLGALIAHGTDAGQMVYNAMTRVDPIYDSGTKKWSYVVTRIFNNNSGATIVVKEIGLSGGTSTTYGYNYLICRDVLASSVSVANGGQLTGQYLLSLTFPV